ncbi:glycosyltransferase [Paenibacillus caui]|uniref:glycosyltransferase n=1 Tax=Paenibacillus caui TaxID=2873927 RepID=UPI001CA937CA|nr:glycosyltransferase [Paenibacillus caui]
MNRVRVNWSGSQFEQHSLAIVNRQVTKILSEDQRIELRRVIPREEWSLGSGSIKGSEGEYLPFPRSDAAVSHQWPPVWKRPQTRRWICMQAWEYGSLPKQWEIPMKYGVDEVWVYSAYNKENYIRSGIPESKIHVIPLGIDENVFHHRNADLIIKAPWFAFLFVGGTIDRKGIDLLLNAYISEFNRKDNVCLIIKDNGVRSFYKGQTLDRAIREMTAQPDLPRMLYVDRPFSEAELAELYRSSDCLVAPYRGEGFGLPMVEAMACGLPIIAPDQGPSRDFCTDESAYFIPSREFRLPERNIGELTTIENPWLLSIDQEQLQATMRYVYEHRDEAAAKGRKASAHILSRFTWRHSAEEVGKRLLS